MSLKEILRDLISQGVTRVDFDYNGIGDEGQIKDIRAYDYDEEIHVNHALISHLKAWLWGNVINYRNGFYDDGYGSHGRISLDLKEMKIQYEVTERIKDVEKRLICEDYPIKNPELDIYGKDILENSELEEKGKFLKHLLEECRDSDNFIGLELKGKLYAVYSILSDGSTQFNTLEIPLSGHERIELFSDASD